MTKAHFTEVPAQVEHRHGPVVPLYELGGGYTPTARHDAAPAPAPVTTPKESPATEMLVSERRRAIDAGLEEIMAAINGIHQRLDAREIEEPPLTYKTFMREIEQERLDAERSAAIKKIAERLSEPVKASQLDERIRVQHRTRFNGGV